MPKDTFINLPEWKRELIFDTAIDEFYAYGYEKASISRIVERAEIAKGSFYQYFEGKEDLFSMVFSRAAEKKVGYLSQLGSQSGEIPFFDLLRVLFEGGLGFIREYPKLSAVIERFMKSSQFALKERIIGDAVEKSNVFLEQLLMQGIERGEIRSDVNVSFASNYLAAVSISLGDHMRSKINNLSDLNEGDYLALVDQALDLLQRGLQRS